MEVSIEPTWKEEMSGEFSKPYFAQIVGFLKTEKKAGKIIYPPGPQIFNAFQNTPFHNVRAVIIGQDPYHNPGQANGLCFSVADKVAPPPSLVNIFKELVDDIEVAPPKSGNLEKWAKQGVLLLNASLTVEENKPMSHSKIGWDIFTDQVIRHVSDNREHVVFMLWGKFAQNKEVLINTAKHKILKAAHPSPLSAYNGFLGCKHFSKANYWLREMGEKTIDWTL